MPIPKSINIQYVQRALLGIAIAFWAIYKWVLKDPDIIKDLGVGYAIFIMLWVMIMLACAGFSGWELATYILDFIKDKAKERLSKVKD